MNNLNGNNNIISNNNDQQVIVPSGQGELQVENANYNLNNNSSSSNNNNNNNNGTKHDVNNNRKSVCIIGAGAAGLVCARHLIDDFEVTIYEKSNSVGGTWCYTDETGVNSITGERVHSSMYRNLRTNLPLNLMEFPDFPCREINCNFESHIDVFKYLNNYSKYFKLNNIIQFNHKIVHVTRLTNSKVWLVKVKNLQTGDIESKYFDTVIIGTGRYSVPRVPKIKGMNTWQGKQIIHTHDYRVPDVFKDQTIFILGAGPSGVDICIEISYFAKKVYLCHSLEKSLVDLDNSIVQLKGTIESINCNTIYLTNGTKLTDVDVIIFATGYHLDLSFVDLKSCQININNHSRVIGLYQHLICISEPTLAIFGVPYLILPFPIYHQQALFYKSLLKGKYKLPSKEQMIAEANSDLEYRQNVLGFPEKYAHKMTGELLWKYDDFLSTSASIAPISKVKREVFRVLRTYRETRTKNYRELKFVIKSDTEYEVIDPYELIRSEQ